VKGWIGCWGEEIFFFDRGALLGLRGGGVNFKVGICTTSYGRVCGLSIW
jgi:hypothetical protein